MLFCVLIRIVLRVTTFNKKNISPKKLIKNLEIKLYVFLCVKTPVNLFIKKVLNLLIVPDPGGGSSSKSPDPNSDQHM
jgi:hypothetical protein